MSDEKFIPASKHPAFAMMSSVTGKPKKGKSASNSLTDAIITYISAIGGKARRVNIIGRTLKGKTVDKGFGFEVKTQDKFIPSQMKPGFEDIDAVIPIRLYVQRPSTEWSEPIAIFSQIKVGLKVAIEVKVGKDTQSPAQKERQREIEGCGGLYIIASDIDSFRVELLEKINAYKG